MNAKTTLVSLRCGQVTRVFELTQAERLLGMRDNGGWHLPEDSIFEYTGYGIRFKQDKRGVGISGEEGGDKEGEGTPELG